VNRVEFGARVRSLRLWRKMTQEALAEASGLASDTVRRLEQGAFNPSLDSMNKLAAGLEITTIELLVDDYDQADDLAALIRQLPEMERQVAYSVLGALRVHVAVSR
jgi:transcriptional regulator with XRE-family HTH domain